MAGNVLPKFALFMFLSIVCMLINISTCLTVSMDSGVDDKETYFAMNDYNYEDNVQDGGTNLSVVNYVAGIGTSFLPFASIISVAFLGLDTISFFVISIIIAIIGAIQAFVLAIIVLNFVPNVLGSGIEV